MKKFMLVALTAMFALSVSAQQPQKKGCCKKEKTECCQKKKNCSKKKDGKCCQGKAKKQGAQQQQQSKK